MFIVDVKVGQMFQTEEYVDLITDVSRPDDWMVKIIVERRFPNKKPIGGLKPFLNGMRPSTVMYGTLIN